MGATELQKKIFKCTEEAREQIYYGNIKKAFNAHAVAWKLLSGIKYNQSDTFLVVDEYIESCRCCKQYVLGNQIIALYSIIALERADIGDREFRIARLMYDQAQFEVAKELFWVIQYKTNNWGLREYKIYRDLAENKITIPKETKLQHRIVLSIENLEGISIEQKQQMKKSVNKAVVDWEMLPYPKIAQPTAYFILLDIVKLCKDYKLYDIANVWISLLFASNISRNRYGEISYLAGELAYAQNQLAIAKELFSFANESTKGKCFENTDSAKYKAILETGELPINLEKLDLSIEIEKHGLEETKEEVEEETDYTLSSEVHEKIKLLCKEGDKLFGKAAIEMYQKALNLLPGSATDWEIAAYMYVGIGDTYMYLEEYQEALNNYIDAYNCPEGVSNPYILFELGACWYELGNINKAREFFIQAYMLDGLNLFTKSEYRDVIKDLITI